MKISELVLSAALGVASLSGVNAFFRMPCSQPVVVERADPYVVNPIFNTQNAYIPMTPCLSKIIISELICQNETLSLSPRHTPIELSAQAESRDMSIP